MHFDYFRQAGQSGPCFSILAGSRSLPWALITFGNIFAFFLFYPDCTLVMWGIFYSHFATAAAKLLQSCPTLCDPRDGSPPGSPIPGILQARTLEWVAISFSNAWKWKVKVSESEVTQSCLTLSDPMDCSLPGSSIHGIFQARVLEWGATTFSL